MLAQAIKKIMGVKPASELRTTSVQTTSGLKLHSLALAFLASFLIILLSTFGALDAAELLSYDLRIRLLSQQRTAHPDIVLIEINDDSFARMQQSVGSWPWPRSLFAALIQHASQAQSITLDLLFSETDQHFIRGDKELAEEVAEHKHVINSVYLNSSRSAPLPPPELFSHATLPENLELPPQLIRKESALLPFKELLVAGAPLGHANNFPDKDGVVRRNPLFLQLEDHIFPSLALSTALTILEINPQKLQYAEGKLHYGSYSIPLDSQGLLRFVPPQKKNGQRYPTYNIADVLLSWNAVVRGETPIISPEVFRDRIVLVGSSAVGLYADRKITPVDPLMPGVILHASLVENLLTQTSVQVFSLPLLYALSLLLALLPLFWKHSQRPSTLLGLGLLTLTLYLSVCLAALYLFNYMLPIAAPLNACFLSLLFVSGLYWWKDAHKRRALEELESAKQTFTDMLVHDLRGQISSIIMAAEMMDRNKNTASSDKATSKNRMVRIIKSSSARLLSQVNALLDIRRMDEGKLKVTPELVNLNDLLNGVAKDYQIPAETIGSPLVTELDPQGVLARVDPELFRRIIENLLWNAMHHGAPGKTISLRSHSEKGRATVLLLNYGQIIPKTDKEMLFQPFVTRALVTKKHKIVGTGLGLTFCQMATEALGGQISVHSPRRDANEGVEFELTFNLETIAPVSGKLVSEQLLS